MAEVVYRPYQDGDEVAINDGFNRVFGQQRSLEEWRWKFPAEPEGRWIMVATDPGGRVLAHYGATAMRMRLGGVTIRAGQPVDVYSLPEVRGTRIFTTCYEKFIACFGNPNGLAVMYGFPGGKHYEMGLKQLQYLLLRKVPYWRRRQSGTRRLPSFRYRVRAGFDRGAVDDLWGRAGPRYPSGTIRDGNWLGRRFCGRPGAEYIHLSVWRHGKAVAWGVVVAAKETLKLAELVWDGAAKQALTALDSGLDRLAARSGSVRLETWLGGDAEAEQALADLGWERPQEPNDLHMVGRFFDDRLDPDEVAHRLYLTMGDADLV